jgi:hypothetical protein
MIEVIAKALYDQDCENCYAKGLAWEGVPNKTGYRKLASAALDALREAGYVVVYQPSYILETEK